MKIILEKQTRKLLCAGEIKWYDVCEDFLQ